VGVDVDAPPPGPTPDRLLQQQQSGGTFRMNTSGDPVAVSRGKKGQGHRKWVF